MLPSPNRVPTSPMTIYVPADNPEVIERELKKRREKTPDMGVLRDTEDNLVFVYGSLMSGLHNNYILRKSKFLGRARTTFDKYEMYTAGNFPVLREVKDDEGNYVYGEAYAVDADTMMNLDWLESNGVMYSRKKIRVSMREQVIQHGNTRVYPFEECWCYFGNEDYWKGFEGMQEVGLTTPDENMEGVGLRWSKSSRRLV